MEEQAVMLEKVSWSINVKQRFDDKLFKIRVNAAKNSIFLTETTYQKLINNVQKVKMTTEKEPRDYWLLNHYDVMIVENKSKLIYLVKEGVSTIQYYVMNSELFHVLHEAHLAIGHGGRDRMVDLIGFQSQPDREYKFIMVYQDHHTKFVILKSLMSKRAEEVAYNLVDIFSLLGAQSILQSDNGREFANNVVTSLKEFWPALKIVYGKPRHSQSQGSVERANQHIENMFCTWMQDNKSDRWSEGLHFIQFMKNRAYHSGIKRTPH
ncbi:KRAB-A domain-containing protein 2-like [Centruroides sculpturatus]|uniref:KRAB-A domain-containing protein 2-like n=1 Tax=Centruroides sculpturatus TaxID=218467 RepID=UPI000C6D3FA8|nr:KRAB-A domain-containing protein 2-like [Centruroides sculpturatus]